MCCWHQLNRVNEHYRSYPAYTPNIRCTRVAVNTIKSGKTLEQLYTCILTSTSGGLSHWKQQKEGSPQQERWRTVNCVTCQSCALRERKTWREREIYIYIYTHIAKASLWTYLLAILLFKTQGVFKDWGPQMLGKILPKNLGPPKTVFGVLATRKRTLMTK